MTITAQPTRIGLALPVLALAALSVLIGLGVWQVERLAWKNSLIAALDARVNAPATALPAASEWPRLNQQRDEFRRVTVTVEYGSGPLAHAYTAGSPLRPDIKTPGYFVFAPATIPSGETVVVNAGFVVSRNHPWTGGRQDIVGYLRWPETPRWFIGPHDASGSLWYVRDHRAMAVQRGWTGPVAPFYIDLESPQPEAGVPRPGPLTVKLRNDHLGYALTWFGLAATLIGVFGGWIWSGRSRAAA